MRFAMQMFTDGIRDREFQKVLQKTRQQNSTEGLVPAIEFQVAKSASRSFNEFVSSHCSRTISVLQLYLSLIHI